MFIILLLNIKIKEKEMISNTNRHKSKDKPYFHKISLDCIEKLIECEGKFNKAELSIDASFKIAKQILTDEIDDPEFLEFAIKNYYKLLSYIAKGNLNIRIHRDIEGKMWFGVDKL